MQKGKLGKLAKLEEPSLRGRVRRIRRGGAVWEAATSGLSMPVCGMESEFNVVLDGQEIDPRKFWGDPTAFIDKPMLRRERSSLQLPTGGAVYFDRGVIEVVTPVIELDQGCTARVVRNIWEQMEFVRAELDTWQKRHGRHIRLKAYSAHYNISFDVPIRDQRADRNVQKLALLLAHILPVPMMLVASTRRSTGIGVRPRGNRIEVTTDFTPDPGLMVATAALTVGIVRAVMLWPSYDLSALDAHPLLPTVGGVVPGKHTTRKGWLTKDFQYPGQSPYTCDVDDRIWRTRDGQLMSLRGMARQAAWYFRHSIRRHADPFSVRHLFSVLRGAAPSLLDLPDRPAAYEDVGRRVRWGMVLPELKAFARGERPDTSVPWPREPFAAFLAARQKEREAFWGQAAAVPEVPPPPASRDHRAAAAGKPATAPPGGKTPLGEVDAARAGVMLAGPAMPVPPEVASDGRRRTTGNGRARRAADNPLAAAGTPAARRRVAERRRRERRMKRVPVPFPDRRLSRSAYEQVFMKLVSGGRLRIGADTYTPVGMRGWDIAVFRRDADGRERTLSIDQLLKRLDDWQG
jgi:hypothetical protein